MRNWLAVIVLLASSAAFAEPAKVTILPFQEIGDNEKAGAANTNKPNWITKAITQSLADEIAQLPGVDVVATATTQPTPSRFTIAGTLQRVDGQLRVTGQVADTTANKSVGGFKATATERELFSLEDSIAEQVKAILRAQIPDAAPVPFANNPPVAARPGKVFEGSDLQRAMNNPAPIRPAPMPAPAPQIIETLSPYYYDDGYYVPPYRSYVSYPSYPLSYSGYPFCYRSGFYNPCFTSTLFVGRVKITSHAKNYSRGAGLVAAYPQLTTNFIPRNEARTSRR